MFRNILPFVDRDEVKIRKITKPYALSMALQHLDWDVLPRTTRDGVTLQIRRVPPEDLDTGAYNTLMATPDRVKGTSLQVTPTHWLLYLPNDFAKLVAFEVGTKHDWGQ